MASDDIIISDGYPTTEDSKLLIKFVVKFDTGNTLCASGSDSRRRRKKRHVTLSTTETFMTQTTLLSIFQTQ